MQEAAKVRWETKHRLTDYILGLKLFVTYKDTRNLLNY